MAPVLAIAGMAAGRSVRLGRIAEMVGGDGAVRAVIGAILAAGRVLRSARVSEQQVVPDNVGCYLPPNRSLRPRVLFSPASELEYRQNFCACALLHRKQSCRPVGFN